MQTAVEVEHPLRLPHEAESLWNYRVCGAPTKNGTPCHARSLAEKDGFCSIHEPGDRAEREAKRLKERAEAEVRQQQAAEDHAQAYAVTAGREFRRDLPDDIRSALFTVVNLKTRRFATGAGDKRAMALGSPKEQPFLVVWTGQWSSHVFILTAEELRTKL